MSSCQRHYNPRIGENTLGHSYDTNQIRIWTGDFGREYTDRNALSPEGLDSLYQHNYGITRTQINEQFLEKIPRNSRILEVGCNMGTQLLLLRQMGFTNLYGIEIQDYALERAKQRLEAVALTQASAFSIPYTDQFFDLVFTSGVLIHIAPADLPTALREIHRCSKRWIWGLEYYAAELTEVAYWERAGILWKTDYARLYLQLFDDLELERETRLPYIGNANIDTVFLLHRRT